MKKEKRKPKKIVPVFLMLMTLALVIFVSVLDILPSKHLLVLTLSITFVNLIISALLLRPKTKLITKTILTVISISIISFSAISLYYGISTFSFLGNLMPSKHVTETYYVVALNNELKIEDIKDTLVFFSGSDGVEKAVKHLEEKMNLKYDFSHDIDELTTELYNENIDAFVLEKSFHEIIVDIDEEFENRTHIIYEFEIRILSSVDLKEVDPTKESFNVYLSGIDTFGKISSSTRSDVNIVLTINPKTKDILITNIPRDYYVQLHGTTGYKDKLTHAGIYGVDMSIKTIEDLLDIDIHYYSKLNFNSVIKIVEALGGIDVNSKYSFTSQDGYYYKQGMNSLNGERALSFVRERKSLPGGDRARGENQQEIITSIIKKISSPTTLTRYNSILAALDGSFETNMPRKTITDLIKMQLDDGGNWAIESANLDGFDRNEFTYTSSKLRRYVMEPDMETVENAKEQIKKVVESTTSD